MIELIPHVRTGLDDRLTVTACARRSGAAGLYLSFRIAGALATVRVPAPAPPRRAADLWTRTCLEAFVGHEDAPAYHELNLSPSGAWAVWTFRDYRDGTLLDDPAFAPAMTVARDGEALRLEATLALPRVPAPRANAAWRLGLAAVLEDVTGRLSYWALAHPRPTPDFHHRGGWTLRLEAPGPACEGESS